MTLWDNSIDRRGTSAAKWDVYAPELLPFWVADMDLPTPDFILDSIRERLQHPVLGYTSVPAALTEAFIAWMQRVHNWQVHPDWLLWMPGVVPGLNVAAQAVAAPNDALFVMPPVYYPFLGVPQNAAAQRIDVPLTEPGWRMDTDALAELAQAHPAPRQRLVLLCNPQNPTGRVYDRDELLALGEVCERHDLVICSDEIHCDLLLDESVRHTPIASIDPTLAQRTITLLAPSKTFNMPGLGSAVAVIPDPALRARFQVARQGMVGFPTVLGYAAATAAYSHDGSWIEALRADLRGNYAALAEVAGARLTPMQGTYLGWIDVRDLPIGSGTAQASAGKYFQQHGLALSDGAKFGAPGFVRFNFAAPPALLQQGLERLQRALDQITR